MRTWKKLASCLVAATCAMAFAPSNASDATTCPQGMVRVSGDALDASTDLGEALQDMSCVDWIDREFPARCGRFDEAVWVARRKLLKRRRLDFCIDKHEWPNRPGGDPKVFVTYYDAQAACESVGKRLCSEEEWTYACEGDEGLSYPVGYSRNPSKCNIDRPWIPPDYDRLFSLSRPDLQDAELRRLWQGVPAGTTSCVSPFGVHDMTGNVDEWTSSSRRTGYRSILKGGYWGPVRNRCRPSTRVHNEWHKNYQAGFRCCVGGG